MQRKIHNGNLLKFYLTEINPANYKDDPDKLDFLGSYADPNSPVKLFRSTNKVKINELLRALKSSTCWEKPIFNDEHLPYYAITAYLHDKITREQISHILEYYELKQTYPDIISLPILTKAGNFTHAVAGYLESLVRCQRSRLPNITSAHLEKSRLSLLDYRKKMASSFCVLYLLLSPGRARNNHVSSLVGAIDSCTMGQIIFPGSVRNIFYPAITPKNSTKTISTGILGKFSIDVIEKKHRKNIRPHALGFPGTFRTTRIHGYNVTLEDATEHDATHQGAISYFPEHLYHMSLHCLDVIRNKTKIKWSEELWPLIDMFVIDSDISTLNEKTDPNDRSFARTYAINESLSNSQCQAWIAKLLRKILSHSLLNIIQYDMTIYKSIWQQWIDVDSFVKQNGTPLFNQAIQKPLTINELLQKDDIAQQITFGFIANWPSITDSVLGKLINFEKNYDNRISLCLFGDPIEYYSNDKLKALLMDIDQENLTGIELVNSTVSGNVEAVIQLIDSVDLPTSFDYVSLALRMAAKQGHDNCIRPLFRSGKINTSSTYYQHGLEDAAAAGHKECVELLLSNVTDSRAKKIIPTAFFLAVKRKKSEIVEFLLNSSQHKISHRVLVKSIATALDHDDSLIAKKIFIYVAKKKQIHKLIDDFNIYKMLRESPVNCISIIMDNFIGHSDLTYQNLFTAIAKSGSIECANEFIKYVDKQYEMDNIERNKILMECMLEGFSAIDLDLYFTQLFNLHHEMVKLQINLYLKSAAFNHSLLNQNRYPKKDDIERLIEKFFSTSFNHKDVILLSLCDTPLYYLIRHEIIKENQELKDYCLKIATHKAIHHQEPYYLQVLLRAGVVLTFSRVIDNPSVNGILIKDLPAPGVRCLLWISYAINEMQQFSPNDSIIRECLHNAQLEQSFEDEIFSLIYTMQSSIHTLRYLVSYLGDEEKFAKIKLLISERIDFLLDGDSPSIDQCSFPMFNKPTPKLDPVVMEDLSPKNIN